MRWLPDANSYPRGKNTITKSHSVFRGPKIGMQSFCQSKCEWGKAKRGQKHQAAYAHVTEQSLTRGGESHTQTCRGSSLSEEIIRMNTSHLSAPPALKIISVTALFPWHRGSGNRDLTDGWWQYVYSSSFRKYVVYTALLCVSCSVSSSAISFCHQRYICVRLLMAFLSVECLV